MTYRKLVPLFLSAAVLAWGAGELTAAKKDKAPKGNKKPKEQIVEKPIVRVTNLVVASVNYGEDGLVAQAVATLNIAGRVVTQDIEIPLDLAGSPGSEGACDILNLAVGPVALDLLGLNVELDDCDDGPVTVDIVAVEGGGLLGDLLCSIAGALNGGASLDEILAGLTDEELDALTGAITDVLDDILAGVLATGTNVTATAQLDAATHRCDILTLEIPEGLSLNVLGLQVDTSPICLDVYAEEGNGNLLGNLLCSLTELLDNPGNNAKGQAALVKNINKVLNRLGL